MCEEWEPFPKPCSQGGLERDRGTSEGTCRPLVLVLALERGSRALPPTPQNQGPKGSAQCAVALGVDPKVKEAQETNRVPHQSRAGDTDGKTGLWLQI